MAHRSVTHCFTFRYIYINTELSKPGVTRGMHCTNCRPKPVTTVAELGRALEALKRNNNQRTFILCVFYPNLNLKISSTNILGKRESFYVWLGRLYFGAEIFLLLLIFNFSKTLIKIMNDFSRFGKTCNEEAKCSCKMVIWEKKSASYKYVT